MLWFFACAAPEEPVEPFDLALIPTETVPDADPAAESIAPAEDGEARPPWACPVTTGTPVDGGWDESLPALSDMPLVGLADPPQRVHLGFGADAAREVTFVWETQAGNLGSRVELSTDGLGTTTVHGVSYEVNGVRLHAVKVCGLEAERSYSYRVGIDGSYAEEASFVTAPTAGSNETVHFAVLGDSRGAPETLGQILAAARAAGVEFFVFTGDAVSSGTSMTDWQEWFDAAPDAFASLPVVFSHGNHEGNDVNFYALFPTATNLASYGLDYGPLHFAIANDTLYGASTYDDLATWLTADLAASAAPWRVATWHRPAVSSCSPHGEDINTRDYLLPVVEAAGAQLVLNGHNHNYERSHSVKDGEVVADGAGTVHIVTGGSGAPLYTASYGREYTAVELKTQHWVDVVADAHSITGTAYDLSGNIIDAFSLSR
jgi:hypothetical protein